MLMIRILAVLTPGHAALQQSFLLLNKVNALISTPSLIMLSDNLTAH